MTITATINKTLKTILTALTIFPILITGTSTALSQESRATLAGKVTDPHGATIQNAVVVVTADETGVIEHATTNKSGDWRVQFLLPGHYHFEVTAPGFKTTEHASVELQIQDQKFVDTQLEVGGRNEVVTVESTTPLIDTTSAVSGTVITTKELEDVSSASHSPVSLFLLAPGASIGPPTGGAVHLWSNISNSNLSMNGSSGTRSNNYQLDGGNDTNAAGQISFIPPMDAVAEVRISANAYDASIGRQAGSTVNISGKTGTSSFHGILYEYNQNNFLNALPWNPTKLANGSFLIPPVHVNEYGGNIGGPVWIPKLFDGRKRKTFFFFTYDGIRARQPGSTGTISLPTLAERKGDFSQSFTTVTTGGVTTRYPILIYDPATINPATGNRQLINGTGTMITKVDPIAAAILALLPAPENAGDGANTDSNNYTKQEVQDDKFGSETVRLDQTWSDAQHSYLSIRRNNWSEEAYDPFGPGNVLQGIIQKRTNRGLTFDHTIVLSPKFLLDARYAVTGYYGLSVNPSSGVSPTTVGFSSSFAALQQLPSLPRIDNLTPGVESTGLGTDNAGSYTNDVFQTITGSMTQTAGNHTFHYGVEYMIQQEGAGGLGQAGGEFYFGNNFTTQNPNISNGPGIGSNLASFELGLPTSGYLTNNATAFWSQHFFGVFFQDDWRATPKLTLNAGLRWDYERPITDRFNRFASRFDPNLVQQGVTTTSQAAYAGLVGGATSNAGIALLQQQRPNPASFVVRGGILYAGVNGTSNYVQNPRYKYFQPRLGFAYQIYPNTVVRGGLGRFVQATFNTATYEQGGQPGYSTNTPFVATTDNYYHAASTLESPYPNGRIPTTGNALGTATNLGQEQYFTDPNIGRPYSDQASASVQQQIGSVVVEIGGTLDLARGLTIQDANEGYNNGYVTNVPSRAVWQAAFTPTFDATGRPVDTLPGNVQVANPFKGISAINSGIQNSGTVTAYTLLRPNPLLGDLQINSGKGRDIYYALNTKVEKRFHKGFSIIQSFSWSKRISENTFIGPQVYAPVIERRLDSGDQRFHYVNTPIYQLPFGRGQYFLGHVNHWVEQLVGGYEITGIYQFQSGTPLVLPTNNGFFQGGDPSLANKTKAKWFDTSKFYPFPNRSTTVAQLAAYPTWTGVQSLPGASYVPTSTTDATKNGVYQDFATRVTYNQTTFGDIRNPYVNDFTLGVRKSFDITESVRFQLRMDAFNALNHPRFGNIDVGSAGDQYLGAISGTSLARTTQANSPRSIELGGKFFF